MTKTIEGLRRLLWEAEASYYHFLPFKLPTKQFYRWQKFNHSLWRLYWKLNPLVGRRIGYPFWPKRDDFR